MGVSHAACSAGPNRSSLRGNGLYWIKGARVDVQLVSKPEPPRVAPPIAAAEMPGRGEEPRVAVNQPLELLPEPKPDLTAAKALIQQAGAEGKTITLMCSSACEDETHCHRSLLKRLIEEKIAP